MECLDEKIRYVERKLLQSDNSYYVYLCGGYCDGTIDEYSDIDMVVFCKDLPSPEKRKEIRDLGFYDALGNTDMIKLDGIKIDINYLNRDMLEKLIEEKGIDYFNYVINTRHLSKMYDVVEKEKSVGGISNFLYSTHQIKAKLRQLSKDTEKLDVSFKRKDAIYTNYLVNYFTERIVKVVYSLNSKPYIYPKKSNVILTSLTLPKGLLENLVYISEEANKSKTLLRKIEKIHESIKVLEEWVNEKV